MEFGFSFLAQWLTPSSLFLLLNLVIGTIVLVSKLGAHKTHDHDHDHDRDSAHRLGRATSGLLARVRSIDLSLYRFHPQSSHVEPDTIHNPTRELTRTPSLLERLKSVCRPDPESDTHPDHDHGVRRSKSEHGKSETIQANQVKTITKSASEKGAEVGGIRMDNDDDESEISAVERRRPATTRAVGPEEEMVGVDAKADDFINRFRQHLRLQRLESLKRFSEMIKGKGNNHDHFSTT